MYKHEYGSKAENIPQRSFLRSTLADLGEGPVKTVAAAITQTFKERGGRQAITFNDIETSLADVSRFVIKKIRQKIKQHIPPPLSFWRLQQKYWAKYKYPKIPLIATQDAYYSFTFRIVRANYDGTISIKNESAYGTTSARNRKTVETRISRKNTTPVARPKSPTGRRKKRKK